MPTIPPSPSHRWVIACAAAACSSAFVCPAFAGERAQTESHSAIVWFSDLNLSQPEGFPELYRRIRAAAHRLCADRNTTVRYWSKVDERCERQAVAAAVGTVGNQRLTALHQEKSGDHLG